MRVERVRERQQVTRIERQSPRADVPERPKPPAQRPPEKPKPPPVVKVPDIPDTGNKDVDKLKKDVEDTKDKVLKGTPLDGVL